MEKRPLVVSVIVLQKVYGWHNLEFLFQSFAYRDQGRLADRCSSVCLMATLSPKHNQRKPTRSASTKQDVMLILRSKFVAIDIVMKVWGNRCNSKRVSDYSKTVALTHRVLPVHTLACIVYIQQ